MKRALYGSLDILMNDSAYEGEKLDVIYGNIQIARDYDYYVNNAALVNALSSDDPDSAYAAGWAITLQRAVEIGLGKRAVSDWSGGYEGWTEVHGIGPLGNLELSADIDFLGRSDRIFTEFDTLGNKRTVKDTIAQVDKDVISGSDGDDIVTITNGVLSGNVNFAVNGIQSDGTNFEISTAATIFGDGGNDIIVGGDLGNDIFGGAGNDQIAGGNLDDWIFGGDGDDKLWAAGSSSADTTVDIGNGETILDPSVVNVISNGDYLSGGDGDDELYGSQGSEWLAGDAGKDTIYGGWGSDIVEGGAGDDDKLYESFCAGGATIYRGRENPWWH